MERQTIRIHRVGSITFGLVLIVTGVLYLLPMFWPKLNYRIIFQLWPLILISLGVEVLAGSQQKTYEIKDEEGQVREQSKVVYDMPAIFLMAVLTIFSMIMGMMDCTFMHAQSICY